MITKEEFDDKKQATNIKNSRQSNFELLRIISMLMILFAHCMYYSFYFYPNIGNSINELTGFNYYAFHFLKSFGQVGVTLFVMISAYFLCTKKFNIKSFLKLLVENILYIITFHFFSLLIQVFYLETNTFTLKNVLNFIPTVASIFCVNYWFIALYLTTYLVFPFFNIIVNRLNKKQHLYLLAVLVTLLIVFSSLCEVLIPNNFVVNNFSWWIVIYLTASYIKLYPEQFNSILLSLLGIVVCIIVKFKFIGDTFYEARNGYYVYFLSLFIFILFKNLNINNNKFINKVASTTLGVYILHDNFLIWQDLLKLYKYINSKFLIFICLGVVIGIFVLFAVIDIIRQLIIEKPLFIWLDKKFKTTFDKINSFFPFEKQDQYEDKIIKYFWPTTIVVFLSAIIARIITVRFDYVLFLFLISLYIIIIFSIRLFKRKKTMS